MCDSCSCGTTNVEISTATASDAANKATYTVTGMTCAHCVSSVSSEVGQLAGVSAVDVDLATGSVTVTSDHPVDRDVVRAAVEEAGYALAGS